MLRWLTRLAISYCILGWSNVEAARKPAFLLTTPSSLMPGENQTLAFNIFNTPSSGHVTISLVATPGGILSNVSLQTDGGSPEVIMLPVPKNLPLSTLLQVSGKFGSYTFEKAVPAVVKETDKKFVTIIQTDKPIYRAGELVRFRVLGIDYRRLPLAEHVGQIWIENPMHFKIAQWHNVSFSAGILQLQTQLSHEPQLGEWSVCCQISDHQTCQGFQVGTYGLSCC